MNVFQEPQLLEQLLTAGGQLAAVGDLRLREAVALQTAGTSCGGGSPSVAATVKLLERAVELYAQVCFYSSRGVDA